MGKMKGYLGWTIDYANPVGEPALLPPSSVQWRVFKNPIALVVGGVAAVLLEFADARVRSGVWDHSVYKIDPVGRSKRTSVAALAGVYGPESGARRVIQGVNKMHARVQGETPNGEAYHALDTVLLDWVSATALYGFLNAYDRFVAPVSPADKSRYYSEGAVVGALYGVKRSPKSTEEFFEMMGELEDRFEPHPIIFEYIDIIESGKAAPGTPKFLNRALARGAVSLLPDSLRQKMELGKAYDLTRLDRLVLKFSGARAEKKFNPNSAACQASTRLGLPANFLYRKLGEQSDLLAKAGLGV